MCLALKRLACYAFEMVAVVLTLIGRYFPSFLTTIVVLAILQSYNPDAIQLIGVQQIARSAISAFAETTPTGSGTTTSAKFFTVRG